MALGSKGGGGGGGRGRPYGMMLILAFGAAVLGVMVLHKLREGRMFSLLIQDKDQDLMALHLLLKKERESSREYKRKIEELKAKANSLRTQKMELSNKVATLQSITTSLKDEQRVLESAIEEKQNVIKTLQQKKTSLHEGNSQIAALKELLKQKEAEIEELKRVTTRPTKIWSVSTDDPSKPLVNGTFPADHEELDGGHVSEKNQNVSETTAMEGNHAGELERDLNAEGSNGKRNDDGEKKVEESHRKVQISGDDTTISIDNNQQNGGFINKDNSNKTEVVSSTVAVNGTEQVTKLGGPEDSEVGDVMKLEMVQTMENI